MKVDHKCNEHDAQEEVSDNLQACWILLRSFKINEQEDVSDTLARLLEN